MAYKAIAKVLWCTFSNFHFVRGGWQSLLTLLGFVGFVGGAYSAYNGNWGIFFAILLVFLFIAAVRIQIDLDKTRHEGRGFLEIIPIRSQINASPALWKDIDGIETEKIRESTIEIALEVCFNNKQPHLVNVHDFAVTLYKHWFSGFPFARIKTETQYGLGEILEGRTQSIKPIRFKTPGNSESARYYFYAWVTIPSGMGAFFAKVKQPILLLHYRADNDPRRHDLRIDIDWELVRSKRLAANTVLGYAHIC